MSLADLFKFTTGEKLGQASLPEIFPMSLTAQVFTKSDIVGTYTKILTDTVERVHGIPEKFEPALWDNCLQSEARSGLITLLAEAMTEKSDLFLVFLPSINVIRRADHAEEQAIRRGYAAQGKSSLGVFVSFKRYRKTEMLEVYSTFEYCVLASLNKTLNLSKAIQFKMSEMRSGVSAHDSTIVIEQAKQVALGLSEGKDVLIDGGDEIVTAAPDTSTAEKAIGFLAAKKAFVLGLPLAYITGEQTGGIGASGENDMRAVERGLKHYFASILSPVLDAVFGVSVKFVSQDFRSMTTALEVLKAFDITSDENLSREEKQSIVRRVFELKGEGDAV